MDAAGAAAVPRCAMLSLHSLLQSLQLLMSEPNPDDGLMVDITHQYTHDYARFERTAREHTRTHAAAASEGAVAAASSSDDCTDTGAGAGATAAEGLPPAPAASAAAGSAGVLGAREREHAEEEAEVSDDSKRPKLV